MPTKPICLTLLLVTLIPLSLQAQTNGDVGWRVTADVLVLSRTDAEPQLLFQDLIGTDDFDVTDLGFGVNAGWRMSAIRQTGSTWDHEVNYTYLPFEETNTVVGVPFNFNTMFAGFVGFGDIQMFDTRYYSQTHSFELNARRELDCYPITVIAGFRYADLYENAKLRADAGGGLVDMLDTSVENHLYGGQLGLEAVLLSRDCWDIDVYGKAGVFAARSSQSTTAIEPFGIGSQTDFGKTNGTALIAEFGVNGRVQLTDCLSLRAGFMMMWLEGVALAPDQWNDLDFSIPTTGVIDNNGGFLAYGGSFGVDAVW